MIRVDYSERLLSSATAKEGGSTGNAGALSKCKRTLALKVVQRHQGYKTLHTLYLSME